MIYIFGHQNPDTDSICSAVALSNLKNRLGMETKACALGEINRETRYALERFGVKHPQMIDDIKTEVNDLHYDDVPTLVSKASILQAFRKMEENRIKTLPVCDEKNRLTGIVTMKDIAMGLIQNEERRLVTHMDNLLKDLDGHMLVGEPGEVDGQIMVMAFFHKTVKREIPLNSEWITIVGDNYNNIEICIKAGVQLVIVTGNPNIPEGLLDLAREKGIPVMTVGYDTYMTSRKIDQCNYLSSIMKEEGICVLKEYEYLEEVYKTIKKQRHTFYPVVDQKKRYLGFIGRNQLLNPHRKQVIMVDHNEYSQSAAGIEEAEILEVVDHHKIGDIRTNFPIAFRNMPVGSTCTIVYRMYREVGLMPDNEMAGVLISGIISDTLNFKSPTTTDLDIEVASQLNAILGINLDEYAHEMFRMGTSLEGLSMEEIFYRDFKSFDMGMGQIGVSQVFTLDIDYVMEMKEEILDFIKQEHEVKKHIATLLVITDIIREGSTLLYQAEDEELISEAFNIEATQGMFVPEVVSRKKQVVPRIMEASNRLDRV